MQWNKILVINWKHKIAQIWNKKLIQNNYKLNIHGNNYNYKTTYECNDIHNNT